VLARKDGDIIRARCAPLSPASGFPVSWSQQVIHEISGLGTKLDLVDYFSLRDSAAVEETTDPISIIPLKNILLSK